MAQPYAEKLKDGAEQFLDSLEAGSPDLVTTGIPGLDDALGGGIMRGDREGLQETVQGAVMATRTFIIEGTPVGAPRMTQRDKWAQRPCVMRYRAWKDRARAAAGKLPEPDAIENLSWLAVFSPPARWSKKKREAAIGTLHRSKPDRDNLDKSVLDALFADDSGIAMGTIEKRWGIAERLEV